MNKYTDDEIFEAMINNANNFGAAIDMFHPDYGQILKDGKPTESGLKFFKDKKDNLQKPQIKVENL